MVPFNSTIHRLNTAQEQKNSTQTMNKQQMIDQLEHRSHHITYVHYYHLLLL
jgi:hypothetical protein